MAATIPWSILKSHLSSRPLRVLDPMVGSGTTVAVASALGHRALGFDVDPLAVLISRAWCSRVNEDSLILVANEVVRAARRVAIPQRKAYPVGASKETRRFVRYWFDPTCRRQLTALSRAISAVKSDQTRDLLWCAFSRLIIVKEVGVSLAMDVAHSRPHRVYDRAPVRPFDTFLSSVREVASAVRRPSERRQTKPRIRLGDARCLPLASKSIDVVITSPPYLNAIDYLRGHRLSLVWMSHDLAEIRTTRGRSVGSERRGDAEHDLDVWEAVEAAVADPDDLSSRHLGVLINYVGDMKAVVKEIARVLKPSGRVVMVVGDSVVRGTLIKNSAAIKHLAKSYGLRVRRTRYRPLPANRRYLPPPETRSAGRQLTKRMGHETILQLGAA